MRAKQLEDVVLNRREDATERLLEVAGDLSSDRKSKGPDLSWRETPVEEFGAALLRGMVRPFLNDDWWEEQQRGLSGPLSAFAPHDFYGDRCGLYAK